MIRRMLAVAMMAGAGVMLGGCATSDSSSSSTTRSEGRGMTAKPAAVVAEPVEVLQLTRGDNAALALGGVHLVKDEGELQALGLSAIDGLSPNWAEQDVVILALGEQTTGGFWADIKGIQLVGDTLFVQGVVNRPGDDAAATQAIAHPFAAALINETSAANVQGDYEEVVGATLPE